MPTARALPPGATLHVRPSRDTRLRSGHGRDHPPASRRSAALLVPGIRDQFAMVEARGMLAQGSEILASTRIVDISGRAIADVCVSIELLRAYDQR